MSKERSSPLATSVHQRLLTLSGKQGADFNLILIRYGAERLLYRLSKSPHAMDFVLKGAMLFTAWTGRSYRPTKDIDLLGFGDASSQRLAQLFQAICSQEVEPDGMEFDTESVQVAVIREVQEYEGHQVKLMGYLGNARISVQIDIGFGDVVTPETEQMAYPTLLDFPAPRIRVYPRETVVAEKLQAMVALGMPNSRMKDFYDLWMIARHFTFEGSILVEAIKATFDRRRTRVPEATPIALSDEFAMDQDKRLQWKAFLKRNALENAAPDLAQIVHELRAFLMPPILAATRDEAIHLSWTHGAPWS